MLCRVKSAILSTDSSWAEHVGMAGPNQGGSPLVLDQIYQQLMPAIGHCF